MFTRRAMLAAAAGVVASRVTDSWAQPVFPTRPVTIVAPFTPGTPADVAARRVAQAMTGTLSRSVVVENRSGAGGTTGSEYVARAEPDGYTIAGTQSTHASMSVSTVTCAITRRAASHRSAASAQPLMSWSYRSRSRLAQ